MKIEKSFDSLFDALILSTIAVILISKLMQQLFA